MIGTNIGSGLLHNLDKRRVKLLVCLFDLFPGHPDCILGETAFVELLFKRKNCLVPVLSHICDDAADGVLVFCIIYRTAL